VEDGPRLGPVARVTLRVPETPPSENSRARIGPVGADPTSAAPPVRRHRVGTAPQTAPDEEPPA